MSKSKIESISNPNILCQYGCGRQARYRFANGKACCEFNISKCPAIGRKKSVSIINAKKTERRIGLVLDSNVLCDYGCGQQAYYLFDNGKNCCEDHYYKCPAMTKSGSDHPSFGKPGWNKGLKKEDHSGIDAQSKKMKGQKQSEEHKRKKGFQPGYNPSEITRKNQSVSARIRANKLKNKKEFIELMSSSEVATKRNLVAWSDIQRESYRKNPDRAKNHSKILERKYREGELVPWNKSFTKDTHPSIARQSRRMREKLLGRGTPFYNERACRFFEQFDKDFYTDGQHATNGGEFYVKDLGYWLDYINFDLKIIIEWDEEFHYDSNDNLRPRDVKRQKEIQEHLPDFKFVRVREKDILKTGKKLFGYPMVVNKDLPKIKSEDIIFGKSLL